METYKNFNFPVCVYLLFNYTYRQETATVFSYIKYMQTLVCQLINLGNRKCHSCISMWMSLFAFLVPFRRGWSRAAILIGQRKFLSSFPILGNRGGSFCQAKSFRIFWNFFKNSLEIGIWNIEHKKRHLRQSTTFTIFICPGLLM